MNRTNFIRGKRAGDRFTVVILAALSALTASAQEGIFPPDKPPAPGSLKQVAVPLPVNLGDFIVNRQAAIVLGKAFFWDQQAGSDGLACASSGGRHNRVRNTMI